MNILGAAIMLAAVFFWPRLPLWLFIIHAISFVTVLLPSQDLGGLLSIPILLELLMILSALVRNSKNRKFPKLPKAESLLIFAMLIWAILSIIFRSDFKMEELHALRTNLFIPIAFFFGFLLLVDDRSGIRGSYVSILLAGLIIIVTGILNLMGLFSLKYGGIFEGQSRMTSTLANPNQTAYILLFIASIFFAFLRNRNKAIRYCATGIFAGSLILVSFTLSRGALVTIMGMLLYALLNWKRAANVKGARYAFLLASFAIVFYAVSPQQYWIRAKYEDPREEYRYKAFRAGISMFLDSPIYGVGYGRYSREGYKYNVLNIKKFGGAHNGYVQIFSELGIIGMLIWFLFILQHWRKTQILIKTSKGEMFGSKWPMYGHSMQLAYVNYFFFNLTSHQAIVPDIILLCAIATRLEELCRKNACT